MRHIAIAVALISAALLISPASEVSANALPYYRLPWTGDESRLVVQGNNQGTHTGAQTYAWDFDATVNNWLVRAARGGIVVAYVDSHNTGGCGQQFNIYTNYVKIDTVDGYQSLYAHLQFASVRNKISVSQPVVSYTPIGNTDSTGHVCGANPDHLHYAVQNPCSGAFCTSVSSSFLDPDVLRQNADGIPRTNQSVISGNHAKGTDTPGVWRGGTWWLSNTFGDPATIAFQFGDPTHKPLVGDWNGQ
ncbi:MAG: M23 family metallopeptidase [Dehalococcoidia bacterium]|nr:M23 family metallopeptidase [Dehalococcoidia bacterium]